MSVQCTETYVPICQFLSRWSGFQMPVRRPPVEDRPAHQRRGRAKVPRGRLRVCLTELLRKVRPLVSQDKSESHRPHPSKGVAAPTATRLRIGCDTCDGTGGPAVVRRQGWNASGGKPQRCPWRRSSARAWVTRMAASLSLHTAGL